MYIKEACHDPVLSLSISFALLDSPQERPVSMRKSLTPGRTPLKSWKDRLTEQTSSPAASAAAAAASPLRSARPALGALGSPFRSPFGSPVTSPFAPRYVWGVMGKHAC